MCNKACNTEQQFRAVMKECRELFSKKLHDYGASWRILRPSSLTDLALYDAHADEALQLMLRKNHDYDEAWRSMRVSSYTDFILTKLQRIKEIEDLAGNTLVSEGIDANYMDIINYAAFGVIKLSEW